MKTIALVLFAMLFIPKMAAAEELTEQQVLCKAKEEVAVKYFQWQAKHHEFLSKYESETPVAKTNGLMSAIKELVPLMQEFEREAWVKAPKSIMRDANLKIADLEKGTVIIGMDSVNTDLKNRLARLEDGMSEMFFKAQTENPICTLSVKSNSSSSSSGKSLK